MGNAAGAAHVSAWSPRESSAQQTTSPSPDLSTANQTKEDFAKQIDIGGGRKMYLECHGTDSPTVILESGYHDSSQPWSLSDGYPPAVLAGLVVSYFENSPSSMRYKSRSSELCGV
jgi:hypothetical protein